MTLVSSQGEQSSEFCREPHCTSYSDVPCKNLVLCTPSGHVVLWIGWQGKQVGSLMCCANTLSSTKPLEFVSPSSGNDFQF